ncbi:MAG TPA: peptidylprolyl isomerase [archaeon]|nr:peptidylprolyl isomerase [archaeon]
MKKGDFVKINYIGRLESGEIFDLTDVEIAKKEKLFNERIKYGPIPVIMGEGFVVKGLEKALESMAVGDKKTVEVTPEDGFGQRSQELVKIVSEKDFDRQNLSPKQGMIVDFGSYKGRIQSVAGGRVTVDFNNPLAGKVLKYEVELVEKVEGSENQVKALLEFYNVDQKVSIENKIVKITAKTPEALRPRLADMILKHITDIESIEFVDTFTKEDLKKHAEHE